LVSVGEKHIDLLEPNGESSTLDFDVLCLCTGASYCAPWRAKDDVFATGEDRQKEFQQVHEQIKAAKTILCIGAGPTSIETAGYLKQTFPEKEISICCRGDKVLSKYHGAHDKAFAAIKRAGVNILLNSKFEDGKCGCKEFDCNLDCSGFKFAGPSEYMKEHFSDCICKKTGQI